MLTVQPKVSMNSNIAFSSRKNQERPIYLEDFDENDYLETRRELMEQRENLEEISNDKDSVLPPIAQKIIKGGAVLTTGLLGGMATGWGTKKSLSAFGKILKSSPVQSFKNHIIAVKKFVIDCAETIKTKFFESEAYNMPAKTIKKHYNNFGQTKFGKPVVEFVKSVGKGIKAVFKKLKDGVTLIYNKFAGIKKETYEKATVNFVGASGGVAAGVTALKENSEKGDK